MPTEKLPARQIKALCADLLTQGVMEYTVSRDTIQAIHDLAVRACARPAPAKLPAKKPAKGKSKR